MVSSSSQLIAALCLLCGSVVIAKPSFRVVGGEDAYIGQFPHQVALFVNDGFQCGGSIISSRFILTAAHCVVGENEPEPLPASYFTVRVGSLQHMSGGQLVSIKNVVVIPTYEDLQNDVALLELQEELQFTDEIQKIDLFDDEVPSGEPVIVSGWGRLSEEGDIADNLQWNTLSAMDKEACNEAFGYGYNVICLAHEKDNGICYGDSGGPATFQGKLVGIASFVNGGCGSTNPDGYAKVSSYREWILENIA